MKRITLLILSILCANILVAQPSFTIGNFDFETISSNTVKITRYNRTTNLTSVSIPSSVTKNGTTYNVTTIGDYSFWNCSNLDSITIPNSITTIEEFAFWYCSGLTSINIPNSVTSIGNNAFENCSSLTSVTISNNVDSINSYMFSNCNSLASISIPNNVTFIGNHAFRGCNLTSITIPANVNFIGSYAFSSTNIRTLYFNANNCTNFSTEYSSGVYLPFSETNISTIIIGNSVEKIPAYFAYELDSVISVSIGNNVHTIDEYAFSGCSNLASITIPNNVTSINNNAFSGCRSLTSITIPYSVTTIEKSIFSDCNNLRILNFNAINCNGNYEINYYSDLPFYNCPISSINIGDSVEKIPAYIAYDLDSLTSITIGNSVTTIEEYAFKDCSNLNSITLPNSITHIGEAAFATCTQFDSVIFPDNVTSIGNYAFYECESLRSITIGSNVTSIGEGAFYDCNNLNNTISLAVMPPTLGEYIFSITGNLKVPCGSLNSYMSSDWNSYFTNIEEMCDSIDDGGDINDSVGINNIENIDFSFYPNPTSGKLSFDKMVEKIEVMDMMGKMVMQFCNVSEINIGTLPKGVYCLKLSYDGKATVHKIIKE